MTSIFEGTQPLKTRPKLQSKQGAPFGFQVYINVGKYTTVLSIRGDLWVEKSHAGDIVSQMYQVRGVVEFLNLFV